MGQTLTFEIGRLNPRRRVKVRDISSKQGGSKQHGMGATLVESTHDHAMVRIDNHTHELIKIPWCECRDWTSQNTGPLIMPQPEGSKPTITVAGSTNGKHAAGSNGSTATINLAAKTVAVPVPASNGQLSAVAAKTIPAATPPPPLVGGSVFDGLDARIDAAINAVQAAEDGVDAALEMYWEAKRSHEQAIETLTKIKRDATSALAAIDARLTGTVAAPVPTRPS